MIHSSRPTVEVAGEVDAFWSLNLTRMDVVHRLGEPALLELEAILLRNEGGEITSELPEDVTLGSEIVVASGNDNLFKGRVTALERRWSAQAPTLVVIAHDALHRLRYAQRRRSYHDLSVGDLVAELANRSGLQADISSGAASIVRPWTQLCQTDFELLDQLAAHIGTEFWVEDERLILEDSRSADDASQILQLGQGLKELAVRRDLAEQTSAVRSAGWVHGIRDSVQAHIAYPQGDLQRCPSGAAALNTMGLEAQRQVPAIAYSVEHADSVARSVYQRLGNRYVTAHGLALDSGWLRVGRWLDLAGIGVDADASFYVRAVHHRYTAEFGMRSRFLGERPCSRNEEVEKDANRDRGRGTGAKGDGRSGCDARPEPFRRSSGIPGRRRRRFR